ncbi:MAG: ATP-binding protein, partial [Myxococcales bacterium]
ALSRRLEIILEGVADGITVQDRSGRVVFANTAAAELCGLGSADELVQATPEAILSRFEVMDEQGNPIQSQDLPARRVLNGEPSSTRVLQIRERATRREWWSHVRATGVMGEDGTPELAVNIWHEVTMERRQERQAKYLADATTALGSSLDYREMLPILARVLTSELADWCAIHLVDQDQLLHVTATHADPSKLALAEEFRRRLNPDPEQRHGLWNVERMGVSQSYNDVTDESVSRLTQDPELQGLLKQMGIKSALIVPIQVRGRILGAITLVSSTSNRRYDQAELQLAEELGRRAGVALENAQLYAAAQHAAKVAEEASRAKDEFLAIVSHELRTPLSAIVGWASLLNERVKDPAIVKPMEVIYRNAQAQIRIIDDILDVSRVITGKLRLDVKPTDVVTITREAIEVVRPSASAKQINIEFKPERDFCLLAADPDRLQQVVWNLLSNAVKFTDSKGNIWVSLRQEGSNVVLSVQDSGRGIDAEFLPYVFDRFRQADASITRRVGGLGLGLALVRHIVELHGGRAFAMSDGLGHGATFTITLPILAVIPNVLRAPRAQELAAVAPVGDANLAQIRVLVVDDEPDARELILTVLTQAGATVRVAGSVSEAWSIFREFLPDILVSDIGMPDEDGYSLMRKIRGLPAEMGGNTPALALTALARDEDRNRAIAAGYDAHLGKPVKPEELAKAVARVASAKRGP